MRKTKQFLAFALAIMMFMTNTVSASATGAGVSVGQGGQNVITTTGETGTPETGEPETGEPETGEPETGTPETGEPETGVPETGTSKTAEPTTEEVTTEEASTEEATTEESTDGMLTADVLKDITVDISETQTGDYVIPISDGIATVYVKTLADAVDYVDEIGNESTAYTINYNLKGKTYLIRTDDLVSAQRRNITLITDEISLEGNVNISIQASAISCPDADVEGITIQEGYAPKISGTADNKCTVATPIAIAENASVTLENAILGTADAGVDINTRKNVSLTIKDTTIQNVEYISNMGTLALENITIADGKQLPIEMMDCYADQAAYEAGTKSSTAELRVSGSLTVGSGNSANEENVAPIKIQKKNSVENMGPQTATFANGDCLAVYKGTDPEHSGWADLSHYEIAGMTNPEDFSIVPEATTTEGIYNLILQEKSVASLTEDPYGENPTVTYYSDMGALKTYLTSNAANDKTHLVTLLDDVVVTNNNEIFDLRNCRSARLDLKLNGHTISNAAFICVDRVIGDDKAKITGTSASLLSIFPANNRKACWENVTLDGVGQVKVDAKGAPVTIDNATTWNVGRQFMVFGDVEINSLSTAKLDCSYDNSSLRVNTSLDADLALLGSSSIHATPGATLNIKDVNIDVKSDATDASTTICLEYVDGTPIAENALTITGDVTCKGKNIPITIVKSKRTPKTENNTVVKDKFGNTVYEETEESFANGETIATVTNPDVTADCFKINGSYASVERSGDKMKALLPTVVVTASRKNPEFEFNKGYASLNDAVKNLAADTNSTDAWYQFIFLADEKLTTNVTLPSFLKNVTFTTLGEEGVYEQHSLDLNGKTLSSAGVIGVTGGVSMCSTSATSGKLVSTYVDPYCYDATIYLVPNKIEGTRKPMLNNVAVTVNGGMVEFYPQGCEENEEHILNATFDVKGFEVNGAICKIGNLNSKTKGYIKTETYRLLGDMTVDQLTIRGTDDYRGYPETGVGGELRVGNLTLQNTYMQNGGVIIADAITLTDGSEFWCYGGNCKANTITSTASRIAVEYGSLDVTNLTVNSAYAGESQNEYTVTALGISDQEGEGEPPVCGIRISGTLNMKAGTLYNDAYGKMEIGKAIVKDVVNGESAQIICNDFTNTGKLTLEKESKLLLNGSAVLNNVNETDCGGGDYAAIGRSKDANVTLKGSFTTESEEDRVYAFVTDAYKDAITTASLKTIVLPAKDTAVNGEIETLNAGDSLFKTEIKTFPSESIQVLPQWLKDGENGKKANPNDAVYQQGKDLKISGNYITVYANKPDGNGETGLQAFSQWKDAVAYINTLNNMEASYTIGISNHVDIMGKLELPTKAADITVRSDIEDGLGERTWREPILLYYQGDIALNTDTTFDSIYFVPYKAGATKTKYVGSIDTKGKRLELKSIGSLAYREDLDPKDPGEDDYAPFKAIKGTKTTEVCINDTYLRITDKMTGIHQLTLINAAGLEANGGLSVDVVYSDPGEDYNELYVYGEKNVLEIKERIVMEGETSLGSVGSIKVKDVVTNGSRNELLTFKENSILITGRVYAETGTQSENVIFIATNDKGNTLANAKLVSPTWFVTGEYNENGELKSSPVYKEGDKLVRTPHGENIRLWVKNGSDANEINHFETLQEAFTEIDRLGDTNAEYVVTIQNEGKAVLIDNTEYKEAVTSFNNKNKLTDFTFPSKAKEVTICKTENDQDQVGIFYNKDIKLKCNVVFDRVLPTPEKAGNISIGGYSLTMKDVASEAGNNAAAKVGIIGNGTNKGSQFITENVELGLTKLDQIDTVIMQATEFRMLVVTGNIKIGDLYATKGMNAFSGLGKIAIENIYAPDNSTVSEGTSAASNMFVLMTKPEYTLDKNDVYTNAKPTLNVSGIMTGSIKFELLSNKDVTLSSKDVSLTTLLGENGNGITIAKAPNAGIGNLGMYKEDEWTGGQIYKQSGNLVYKTTKPQVTLSYAIEAEGESASTTTVTEHFETYADAIAQINALKTKRDYTITFLPSELKEYEKASGKKDNATTVENPVKLTAPDARFVDTLTLTSKNGDNTIPVYFIGDITFNSNILLKDIVFKQVITQNKTNYVVEDTDVKNYVNPVNVKVNGAYTMNTEGLVTFNNALALNGANKATLIVDDKGLLRASVEPNKFASHDYGVNIEGSIKNFDLVKAERPSVPERFCSLCVLPYATGSRNATTLKPAEMNVTNLSIDRSYVYVGQTSNNNSLTVKGDLLTNSGELYVHGNATLKNVSLSGNAYMEVYGQTFNITGTVTSATKDALLRTALNAKNQSALNISGDVVLTDPDNKIKVKVKVMIPDGLGEGNLYLGGKYTDANGKEVTISNKLLTAKKADANAFAAHRDCLDRYNNSEFIYEENSESRLHGYILRKTGNDITVHYADEVAVALYKDNTKSAPTLYNYYTSFNEAVAAIDALNDVNQSYGIDVLQDVGKPAEGSTKASYEKVNLPKKASKVGIYSRTDKGIYYSNDLSLGCNTCFEEVGLYPAVNNGKEKLIHTNGYELTMNRITSVKIGGIKGNKKSAASIQVMNEKSLEIDGNVTDLTKLKVNANEDATLTITGNLKVDAVEQSASCDLETKGSAVITDYTMDRNNDARTTTKWTYKDLTINGTVESKNDVTAQFTRTNCTQNASKSGVQVKLADANRLLTVKKADLDKIAFMDGKGSEIENLSESKATVYALWANGAVYAVNKEVATNAVNVHDNNTTLACCLDMTQASAYVNVRSVKNAEYTFLMIGDVTDTCVTDTNKINKLTLPAKDRMSSLCITNVNSERKSGDINFTGDITVNGYVKFESVALCNEKDFSVKCVSNSTSAEDVTNGVYFSRVTVGNEVAKGKLKNITGDKKNTVVKVYNTTLDMAGGITKVSSLTLDHSLITTRGQSEVGSVISGQESEWNAFAQTTIGSIERDNKQLTLGTIRNSKGVPQMTITGDVSDPVIVVLYDYDSKTGTSTRWLQNEKPYNDQALLIAKTAPADRFWAVGCLNGEENGLTENIKAYKDANNYVYNGDLSKMEVILTDTTNGQNGTTYAKTYAEAISIINNTNNANGEYTITLRNTTVADAGESREGSTSASAGNQGVIKTALKNGNAATYGALALPKAGKAKSLTIVGEYVDSETDNRMTLCYTGTMKPQGNMQLIFDNLLLTEGKVDTKGNFNPTNTITLELGTADVTFKTDAGTPDADVVAGENMTEAEAGFCGDGFDLVFTKITSKTGTLRLDTTSAVSDNTGYIDAFVIGDAAITNLVGAGEDAGASLASKGKMTIQSVKSEHVNTGENSNALELYSTNAITLGDIKGEDVRIHTAYTKAAWTKALTQLTINGVNEADLLYVNLYRYYEDTKEYKMMKPDSVDNHMLCWDPSETAKPAAYQKLITAPKMGTDRLSITQKIEFGSSGCTLIKMDGGIYRINDLSKNISVHGYTTEADYSAKTNACYEGIFYSWDQAVKEIDRLNHKDWYYGIEIIGSLSGAGGEMPKNISFPSKAERVAVYGNRNNRYIPTISTTVTMKTDLDLYTGIFAYKMVGKSGYSTAYTINVGNYELCINGISDIGGGGYVISPRIKLTGSSKGSVTVTPRADQTDYTYIEQIKNIGTVQLNPCGAEAGCSYTVADGISGVGNLILDKGTALESRNTDLTVKNLTTTNSFIWAKNITVSDTLTMKSTTIKAGSRDANTGKMTLNNVVVGDVNNVLEGKQDKNGKSQIQIKGTVVTSEDHTQPADASICIGLYYNNSISRYAQLYDGMILAIAPKAPSSLFRPLYDDDWGSRMGPCPLIEVTKRGENGEEVVGTDNSSQLYPRYYYETEKIESAGVRKSGNNLVYTKLLTTTESQGEHGTIIDPVEYSEVRVWMGEQYRSPHLVFASYEEAVKAIDSMASTTSSYTIQFLQDAKIGNEKGNNTYNALPLPSKAAKVTIDGDGHSVIFSGNLTLKSNTEFKNLTLMPVKTVKKEVVPAEINLSIGNYKAEWNNAYFYSVLVNETGEHDGIGLGNITGSAKGELVLHDGQWLDVKSVTGLNRLVFDRADWWKPAEDLGGIWASGNVTVKEIMFMPGSQAKLGSNATITANVIYVGDGSNATLAHNWDKPIKVNGMAKDAYGNTNFSVVTGSNRLKVRTFTENGELEAGTRIVTGKYLDNTQWTFYLGDTFTVYDSYMQGNDICVGAKPELE